MKRWAVGLAIVLALLLAGFGANTWRQWAGLTGPLDLPAARRAQIEPYWRLLEAQDDAAGVAVLLSGCDGVHDNMDFWASQLVQKGHPSLIIDSHRPRKLDRMEAWRLVCAGQALTGAERAGDLAVALADPAVFPRGALVLGASHGGWTTLEFLRLALTGQVPPGLRRWPESPARLLQELEAVVLLYPYCGLMNGADRGDWTAAPPILMILAANDRIVSTPECQAMADRLRARGARIEVTVIPGADHAFDQRERAPLSPLNFDADSRDAAARSVSAFLAALD